MLLTNDVLEGIVSGKVDRAYRRWARPTVRAGGTLKTRRGVLAIVSVRVVDRDTLSEHDARKAGSPSLMHLLRALDKGAGEEVYRIGLRFAGEDPRIALRAARLDDPEARRAMAARLRRMDDASAAGPWTRACLSLIQAHPARRAEDLAHMFGWEKKPFKTHIRRLKALGLTESLKVGYRLSPRGESVMELLSDAARG